MERALPCALLLLCLLGRAAGEEESGACRPGPYDAPLLDGPVRCPGRSDGPAETPIDGAQSPPKGPGKQRAGDPPAEEPGRPWALLSGVSAGEVRRSPAGPTGAGIFLMESEQCHKWVEGQENPIETFQCPTQHDHPEDMFCCGTCTASYCCSSLKDHLEQMRCFEVTEGMEDPGAGESTGPSVEHVATMGIIEFVLIAIGLVTICIGISYILHTVQDEVVSDDEQRDANEDPAEAAADQDVSACLKPSSSGRGTSELPSAVANSPDGAGIPMDAMKMSVPFIPTWNLEVLPEEDETDL